MESRGTKVSAAFFCPQNKPPKPVYLDGIRRYLRKSPVLAPFRDAILDLPSTWNVFAQENIHIANMTQGAQYAENFRNWVAFDGSSSQKVDMAWSDIMSGLISLPLLTVMQIVQYFQYLETRHIRHAEFLNEIRTGGAQGYCAGLLPAFAIAVSRDEREVVRNASIALRLAQGIGAYGELGDDENVPGPTTVVLRTKYTGQAEEIITKFPGVSFNCPLCLHIYPKLTDPKTYISAITDPETISVVGPSKVIEELRAYAEIQGVTATKLHLRGKIHNPENEVVSNELIRICYRHPELLLLPNSSELQVPVRSNMTGNTVENVDSLSEEIVRSTLMCRCEWHSLLISMATELRNTNNDNHTFLLFGTGRKNCVPTKAFEDKNLHIEKLDVMVCLEKFDIPRDGRTLDQFPSNAVAIVGAGCRLPGANSIDELWELLEQGIQRVEKIPISRVDVGSISRGTVGPDGTNGKDERAIYGNFLDDADSFDHSFFGVSPREAMYMDPQQRLLLETAYEALDSSGYLCTHRREDFDNVGCFIGASYTEYTENTSSYSPTAYTATGTIRAFQCGKISYHFGWSGPSEVIDTACSASLVAVNRACKAIQSGECPMALAGGVNLITGVNNYLDLGKAGFLSPTGQCKPFDSAADGYCRADGVGLVALKSLSQAVADGNHVLGVILGVSTNQGGLSPAITVPYSRAQVSLFRNVTDQSGLQSSQISYVETHGTGTQVGDPIEISSVREVFGGAHRDDYLHIGSLKANVGHSETAAGIGSLMKVLAMLKHGKIPALAGFKTLNPKIPALEPDFLRIPTEVIPWDASFRAACVNSYGAAGSNSALICSEGPVIPTASDAAEHKMTLAINYPICITAASKESLRLNLLTLASYIRKNLGNVKIADLAFTLCHRRKHHRIQWIGNACDVDSLANVLESSAENAIEVPKLPKPVVLVFSGQSKETIGLNESLYQAFPCFRHYIHSCDSILLRLGYSSMLGVLFTSDPIKDIVLLQCGTFAVQYASAMCWLDSGLPVAAVVGHSFGELTAMAVSGILSLEDALKLISFRASLMQTKWGSERGTMLALEAELETVRDIIGATDATLEIACFNGNKSHVLVGAQADIEKVEERVAVDTRFRSVRSAGVKTSHGFHSVFTQPILQELDTVAQSLNFKATTLPFEACTDKPLEEISSSRIVQHTRAPVYFGAAIGRLEQRLGSCIWLEAGTDSPIISMTKRAVENASAHTFLSLKIHDAVDASAIVSNTTTSLWREGVCTSFWGFLSAQKLGINQIWLPPYQFQRTRHWLQHKDPVTEERRMNISNMIDRDPPRGKLVTAKSRDSKSWSSLEFNIGIETSRFTDIVSGHAVRGKPLCPASMYMECVVMAAQMIEPGVSVKSLKFQDISFQGALGLNYERDVTLQLDGQGDYLTWSFTIQGIPRHSSGKPTIHAKGIFSVTSMVDFQLYERMISDRINDILANPHSERLMAGRAYTLFSRVVNYSDALRGISAITILDNRYAVAEVFPPKTSVSRIESTASEVCDTVTLDTFIQVVGLLINSGDRCPADEVFIATSIDSVVMQNCDFTDTKSWTVYAMATARSESNVAGDMFVFTNEGKLVFTGSGVQFTKVPIAKLEKILHGITVNSHGGSIGQSTVQSNSSHEHVLSSFPKAGVVVNKPSAETLDDRTLVDPQPVSRDSYLKSVMIKNDESLNSLGLDSISKIEFFNQIRSGRGTNLTKDELPRIEALNNKFSSLADNKAVNIEEIEIISSSPESAKSIETHSKLRTKQRILEMIADNSGQSTGSIEDETSLQDIGIDSLSIVELKESFENGFGVKFGDWDYGLHSTVKDILEFVQSRL